MDNSRRLRVALAAALTCPLAQAAGQAWNYPAFQPPITQTREFNFGIADAGRPGTALLVQWREVAGARGQFTLEGGLVSRDRRRGALLVAGGSWAYQLTRAEPDLPLDLLFTAGAGLSIGDPAVLRIPVGVVAGHRFELDGNLAITPYVHPRLSIDLCGDCTLDEPSLGIDFDLGGNLEITETLAVRAAAYFGSGEVFGNNGIGVSLAWRPPGLRRSR
jgi:hypothetical protein